MVRRTRRYWNKATRAKLRWHPTRRDATGHGGARRQTRAPGNRSVDGLRTASVSQIAHKDLTETMADRLPGRLGVQDSDQAQAPDATTTTTRPSFLQAPKTPKMPKKNGGIL